MKRIVFWNIKNQPNTGKFQYEEGLGCYKLATIAKESGLDPIVFQDHQFNANSVEIKEITRQNLIPGKSVVAYSLLSNGLTLLEELIKNKAMEGYPIIIGGPGATIEPEKVLGLFGDHNAPVALVQGDGEPVFRELITTKPYDWTKVKGVWSRNNGDIIRGSFLVLDDLDSSPFADLSSSFQRRTTQELVNDTSIPLERRVELLKSLMISQIEASKGCYYNCGFCSSSSLEVNRVRKSSPERLVGEMENMFSKDGVTFFSITDNVAFDKAEWWNEFFNLISNQEMNPYIQYGGYSAPKFLNNAEWLDDVIPSLYMVGLRGIILGVQAGSKRILKIAHRSPNDPNDALEIAKRVVPLGVNLKVDFIVGHPTEKVEDLDTTLEWANKIYNAGGEVFIRKLGIVPHSEYHANLERGLYELPKETPEFQERINTLINLKARDDRYKEIAFANGQIPNKYLIDRELGIIYPSTMFDLDTLKSNLKKLNSSGMPQHIKERYMLMFDLVIQLKSKKAYEF